MSDRARILVVDDDPAMLRSMQRILERGYEVTLAQSAEEALLVAPSVEADLAILDIRMPSIDGFELMARLRRMQPEIDVIFITGLVSEMDSQFIRAIREEAFYFIQKPFDREVLLTLVERCLELRKQGAINRAHVERLEEELAEARAFQRSMLPPDAITLAGHDFHARYEPCEQLGGDFYDFTAAGEGRAAAIIADASGHGASAAMLTGIVKASFHASSGSGYDPSDIVQRIAAGLRPFPPDRFVTAFCLRLSREGRLEFVNAGHPPALVLGRSDLRELPPTGPLISSAFPSARWEMVTTELSSAERLLLYSDGVPDADARGDAFGVERLVRSAQRVEENGASRRGDDVIDRVVDDVREFLAGRPLGDDLTLVTVARSTSKARIGA